MDLTSSLLAYDEVISQAAREGRTVTTADKLRAMKAAIEAYERDTNEAEFKRFHQMLCERFGYTHDERDWKRDQLSLIEFIAGQQANQIDIGALVNRFLGWPLPDSLHDDLGRIEKPIGTHLMNADEARAMLEYVLARRFRTPGGITSNEKDRNAR